MKKQINNRQAFTDGMRDGLPIALGYLAVSFSLGIAARNAGLNAFQGFLASILTNASAGEYACFTLIASAGTYLEMAVITLIASGRYLLMSCSLSQKFSKDTKFYHRLFVAHYVTDEIFGINIARPGFLNPFYTYGAAFLAGPCWAIGTSLGILAGNMLPDRVVSALSVALYGMFLAIIIPPAKKDKLIALLVVISFLTSYLASVLPVVKALSEGTRTIILTVAIAGIAAIAVPRNEVNDEQ